MNALTTLYLQAVLQSKATQPEQEDKTQDKEIKKEYNHQASLQNSIQYLQKQQLINLIQQQQRIKETDLDGLQQSQSINGVQIRMTNYLNQQIKLKETVLRIVDEYPTHQLPYVVKLVANIILFALNNSIEDQALLKQQYKSNPLLITLSYELWRAVSTLITQHQVLLIKQDNSNLFAKPQDNIVRFVSQMILFREEFNEKIYTNLHAFQVDQTHGLIPQLSLGHLHQFLIRSKDDVWTAFVYKLFNYSGQKVQSLTRTQCAISFSQYISLINHYFKKNNLIMNVVESNLKETKQIHNDKIFQEYLLVIGQFKANSQEFFRKIVTHFFSEEYREQELELIDFSAKTLQFQKEQNTELMFILPKVIQLEAQLIDHISQNIQDSSQETQINSSNYYIKMIQKLKSKCVYNGEDQCDCKKCQCIRRNRNSARESQKKKREALEKLGPLQESYEVIAKKVRTLEDENNLLRGLLIDIFKHPALQQISSQFIEPLTKIISADSDDFTSKNSYLMEC